MWGSLSRDPPPRVCGPRRLRRKRHLSWRSRGYPGREHGGDQRAKVGGRRRWRNLGGGRGEREAGQGQVWGGDLEKDHEREDPAENDHLPPSGVSAAAATFLRSLVTLLQEPFSRTHGQTRAHTHTGCTSIFEF